jgi:hypothetical protein
MKIFLNAIAKTSFSGGLNLGNLIFLFSYCFSIEKSTSSFYSSFDKATLYSAFINIREINEIKDVPILHDNESINFLPKFLRLYSSNIYSTRS